MKIKMIGYKRTDKYGRLEHGHIYELETKDAEELVNQKEAEAIFDKNIKAMRTLDQQIEYGRTELLKYFKSKKKFKERVIEATSNNDNNLDAIKAASLFGFNKRIDELEKMEKVKVK